MDYKSTINENEVPNLTTSSDNFLDDDYNYMTKLVPESENESNLSLF
jgi:hypothetical protein